MTHDKKTTAPHAVKAGILSRVLRDKRGNTLAIVGAALVPMAGMIGSGVDISRGYLAKARLQQACDAGALAARKTLGGSAIANGALPSNVTTAANNFFNVNFSDGAYGTRSRTFSVAPTANGNIKGTAAVTVPTAIMKIFGKSSINLAVTCTAELSISDIDVMFVLDTTGSMDNINSGDTVTRIQALKNSVLNFYDSVQSVASATSKVRYGFVPYSTTVNVGRILPAEYVRGGTAGEIAPYQSRQANYTVTPVYTRTQISQTAGAEYQPSPGSFHTTSQCNNYLNGYPRTTYAGNGDELVTSRTRRRSGGLCYLTDTVTTWRQVHTSDNYTFNNWTYRSYDLPVRDYYLSTAAAPITTPLQDRGGTATSYWPGCIEEVATVPGNSFTTGIPTAAFAEQMDYIPTATPSSKWKPMWWDVTYNRQRYTDRTSATDYGRVSGDNYACPTAARKLATYPKSGASRNADFVSYVNSLVAGGFTIHDTGLIWGARLISPTGLFASENVSDRVTRHIIFMTDGQMDIRPATLSSWGVEEMQGNTWGTSSQIDSGDEVALENLHLSRMAAICSAIKNRNITLWVIAFGTTLTTPLSSCADSGKSFTASNQTQLNNTFQQIASQIAELRLTQ